MKIILFKIEFEEKDKKKLKIITSIITKIITNISFLIFKYFPKLRKILFKEIEEKIKEKNPDEIFIIGTTEIANNLVFFKEFIPNSINVCLYPNKFYMNNKYDIYIDTNKKYNYIISAFIFGYLLNISNNFFYIWSRGFLLDIKYELKFLKSKNKKIYWYLCGDDIRSIVLTQKYLKENNIDGYANYYPENYTTKEYDNSKKELAAILDNYCDIIFNHKIEQISYLNKKYYTRFYCYPLKYFNLNKSKYEKIDKILILHAPSWPLFKGTPLVRAAIKKLQLEGYNFEYIEIIGQSNEVVLEALKKSHIVLDQFYAYTPGTFTLEALANYSVLFTSFDFSELLNLYKEDVENLTNFDFNEINLNTNDYEKVPWVVCKYYEIYDKLKFILENPYLLPKIAENGFNFAKKYFSENFCKKYFFHIINKHKK